jgi:hypothetical protein
VVPQVDGTTAATPTAAMLRFRDATEASGLRAFVQANGDREKSLILESIGGGVGWIDYDSDGDLDAWLTNGGSLESRPDGVVPRDDLYANDGKAHFESIAARVGADDPGWTTGIAVADVDNDGHPDVYLSQWGPNVLLLNRGGKSFERADPAEGAADPEWSTSACFFDADRDGDLDVYVSNYVTFDPVAVREKPRTRYKEISVYAGPRGLDPAPDTYWTNDGSGRYVDATVQAGFAGEEGFGFQAVALDADDDGWLDLFVANDSVANALWIHQPDGTFREGALRAGVALSKSGMTQAGMGVAIGDANGDARLDLYLTTFSDDSSTLFRSEGRGFFRDVSQPSGLAVLTTQKLKWGALLCDLDGDVDLDLVQVNGHVYPQVDRLPLGVRYQQEPQLFENRGAGRYRDASRTAGSGFATPLAGRGLAAGDCDGDGDVDLLIGQIDGPPMLLLNESLRLRPSLRVTLRGTKSPRDPVGALVLCVAEGEKQLGTWLSNQSFSSAHQAAVWFAAPAGNTKSVLWVRWPSGGVESFDASGQPTAELEEGRGTPGNWPL